MQTSFAKLGQGWGVKVSGNLGETTRLAGRTVEVRKADGSSKTVTLGSRIDSWNAGRASIYAIAQAPRRAR